MVITSSPILFFLFSQGCPLPPSFPMKRLGSDHLDVWALPRGQGGLEGGRLLPDPTLSPRACCAAFVPRLASPFPSCSACFRLCLISPPASAPPPPQRSEMSAQDMGPICVSPACPFNPSRPVPTSELPCLTAWPHPLVPKFLSTTGLLPPPGLLLLLTKVVSYNKGRNLLP